MRRSLAAFLILGMAGSPAFAVGPNAGGTMVVHDTGLMFSTVADLPVPPPTTPPASCQEIDNMAPVGDPQQQTVWKVYAAFPDGSSPRLKGLTWGIAGTGVFYVTCAGLPDPPNCFQIVSGSWPTPPGDIGQSFVYTQTTQLVECYWFGGYGYDGVFSTCNTQVREGSFVDDAVPGNVDIIQGYSSLGFGTPGTTVCPDVPHEGACCYPDGSCQMVLQDECVAPGVFMDGPCDPNPCLPCCDGACCFPSGDCQVLTQPACEAQGGSYQGDDVPCTPYPCPPNPIEQRSWGSIKETYR